MKKKLIEVALPLDRINAEAARRKRKSPAGYPTTLHKWWAQRPLAACRAVLFASLVDDPSSRPDEFPTEEEQTKERQRLFRIIEELVKWENSENETVLSRARAEILKSTNGNPPAVLDPFCGGGSIPLEAQRLGLEAYASDLNPVAVLITKALIELPPKFANRPPVNPEAKNKLRLSAEWKGVKGLATDVRYYGKWLRDEAEKRIGHFYPKVKLENGRDATVIAWLWARTVKCPNPACGVAAPLIRSYFLSTKKGREVWVRPRIDRNAKCVEFDVETSQTHVLDEAWASRGSAHVNEGGRKANAKFRCISCETTTIDGEYVDREADAGRMSVAPVALVADGDRHRIYVAANREPAQSRAVKNAHEYANTPDVALGVPSEPARGTFAGNAQGRTYGFKKFADYFTGRQLVALSTFSMLVGETREQVLADARKVMIDDGVRLEAGGAGADAYAETIATYLALAIDRAADYGNSIATWRPKDSAMRSAFAKQAIPMTWDYAEGNPFANSSSGLSECCEVVARSLEVLPASAPGSVVQRDASASLENGYRFAVCTDPPYYDNIGYADLSDFFYVWLRRSLSSIYPALFSTILVPKSQELIATPYRFDGDQQKADRFFEDGLLKTFRAIANRQDPSVPFTVFYAFKQEEGESDAERASTGWEMMLQALVDASFMIDGTWPLRTEGDNRQVGVGTNALASSVLLVCRKRTQEVIATRRQFIAALKSELPDALKKLQHSNIAAVDLAQAAIGPGMAVFSRHAKVIEADGSTMRVRSALQLINQALDEVLSEQESDYDADTQWAVTWFSQFGMSEAPYGEAEKLSTAKNTSVGGLGLSGLLRAPKGKVQLIAREQLDAAWDPTTDRRLTIWEVTQHLIARLKSGGEQAAADLLRKVGGIGEIARDLAYRLYAVCERKGWTEEAIAYNSLVVAWPEITRLAAESQTPDADEQMPFG